METLSMEKVSGRRARRPARPHQPASAARPVTAAPAPGAVPAAADNAVPAAPLTPAAPGPATTAGLARLDDRALLRVVRAQPITSPSRAAACELLVTRHRNLVRSCVARYNHSPEPAEDLMQVGYVGLLKAINNFDPDVGRSLAAYAWPCITGEIKRHFRDKR